MALHFARETEGHHRDAYQRLADGMRLAAKNASGRRRPPQVNAQPVSDNTRLLKDVISVARDGADFYDRARSEIGDPDLQRLFGRMADVKREMIAGLIQHVRILGGEPPADGTALGSLRESYAQLRVALGRDDARIYADQLEQAEDRLLRQMQAALKGADPAVRSELQTYLSEVQACHDEMRNLKAQMQTHPTTTH